MTGSGDLSSLPGFREFYPRDLALRSHILSKWREVSRRYGFQEYDGPPLESLEMYTRKSGPEIVEQLYAFEDRGGREVALRPEMTPTFARMVSARAAALPKPIRWFSVPQLFRYERPQRGRLREHFQLNADIVGEPGVSADAEAVALALDALRALGLEEDDVVARISSRRLAGGVLRACGVPEGQLQEAFRVLDRLDRESEDRVRELLVGTGTPAAGVDRILEMVGAPLEQLVREFSESEAVAAAGDRLEELFRLLDWYGLGDFVCFDARLVRGLAYYTDMVFEVWERSGELRAVCGGGRYDDLLESLGGVDLPAVGFGMGDVVLGELLRERGLTPGDPDPVEDFVVYVSERERPLAMRLVRALREGGRAVTFDLSGRGVGRQFRAADQMNARRVFVLGPDEVERGVVTVRSMESGDEREVDLEEVLGPGSPES